MTSEAAAGAAGQVTSTTQVDVDGAVNVVRLYGDTEQTLISGDDSGRVHMWDLRQPRRASLVWRKTEHCDFISDVCAVPDKHHLLVGSGDGHLSVWDVRHRGSLVAKSDHLEDELLSMALIKNGQKLVCGSQEGVLMLFSYGDFGDMNDRFIGHPESIDCMVVIDQDTICTGSSDGILRVVQVLPNKLLGVLGQHQADCPIEHIAQSFDNSLIASCSHDERIRFWPCSFLYESDVESDAEGEGRSSADEALRPEGKSVHLQSQRESFFADL